MCARVVCLHILFHDICFFFYFFPSSRATLTLTTSTAQHTRMVRKKRALARTSAHDEALIGSILDMRGDDSFVLDTDGADLPPEPEPEPEPGAGVQKDERGLVLPSHVQFVPMDVEMEQDADADADGDGDGDGDGFTENVVSNQTRWRERMGWDADRVYSRGGTMPSRRTRGGARSALCVAKRGMCGATVHTSM